MTRFRGWVQPIAAIAVVGLLVALFAIPRALQSGPPSTDTSPGGGQAATAAPLAAVPAAGETGVLEVASAEAAALEVLTTSLGTDCVEKADIAVATSSDQAEQLDKAIMAAKFTGSGWVRKGMWLGDLPSAAKAFAATSAFSDERETWIVTDGADGTAVAKQMVALTSASGGVVWVTRDQARGCTHDPKVDEGDEAPIYPTP